MIDSDGTAPRMRLTGADLAEVEKAAAQKAVRKIVAFIRHDSARFTKEAGTAVSPIVQLRLNAVASALTTTAAYIERGFIHKLKMLFGDTRVVKQPDQAYTHQDPEAETLDMAARGYGHA